MPETIDVPWKTIPVSEPVLPGEFSARLRQERGQPVNWAFLITTAAGITTTKARRLVQDGIATVNGQPLTGEFGYIKPGDILRIGDARDFVIGPAP